MKTKQVAIIIPIYNLWKKMTLPCLESLAQHTQLEQVHVYLIDNASSDVGTKQILRVGKSLFGDRFTHYRFEENKGFAIACNYGAKLAGQNGVEFILLLNNDTLVTPNWLPPLLDALEEPKIGAVGPLLLYPKSRKVQHCGVVVDVFGGVEHLYSHFPANHPFVLKKRYLHYITGAVFLIKTKLFFEVGMLCEEFLNGFEDIDLCHRITNKGYLFRVVSESVVYHFEGQSAGRYDTNHQNSELFTLRNNKLPPDSHSIAKKDGYIPSLTKELRYYIALPREKANTYTEGISSRFSLEACEKLLEKEPLWVAGYKMLAEDYDKQNMGVDACKMIKLALRFCPSAENYSQAISLLYKYQQNKEAKRLELIWGNIVAVADNINYQKKLEQYFHALSKHDSIYQDIYDSRLQNI